MINETQDTEENFSDWLAIHQIDYKELVKLARRFPPQSQEFDEELMQAKSGFSAMEAWELCASSLAKVLPAHATTIHSLKNKISKSLSPKKGKLKRPYTLDKGGAVMPFVSCYYKGNLSDLISLAHEFSHAIQIVLSREAQSKEQAFMPPMPRECCAFLGEIALIDSFEKEDPDLYKQLKKIWLNENLKYLKTDVNELCQAIENNQLSYSYNWNYPIARLYAVMLRRHVNNEQIKNKTLISQFFESGANATELMSLEQLIDSLPIPNPLPSIPKPEKHGFTKYQILGAVIALAASDNREDKSTGSFFQKVYSSIKENLLFVYFKYDKPVGFAFLGEKSKEKVVICELCTPFVGVKDMVSFMQRYYNCKIEMQGDYHHNNRMKGAN